MEDRRARQPAGGNEGAPASPKGQRSLYLSLAGATVIFALAQWPIFSWLGQSAIVARYTSGAVQQIASRIAPGVRNADDPTVVLVDARSLQNFDEGFPPSREFHAEALARILELKPRFLFVDIWFDEDLDERQETATELLAHFLSSSKEKVLLAGYPDADGPGRVSARIRNAVAAVSPAVASLDKGDLRIQTYDLLTGSHCSPALHLYSWLKRSTPCSCEAPASCTAFRDALDVRWSTVAAPVNEIFLGCVGPADSASRIPWRLLSSAVWTGETLCPPFPTVLATSLLASREKSGRHDHWISDRVVFYGLSADPFGDRIDTPVAAAVPGVYLHAMAFSNLLTYGERYVRDPSTGWRRTAKCAGSLIVVTVLAFLLALREEGKRLKGHARLERLASGWGIVAAIAVTTLVATGLWLAGIGVGHWGVALLAWIVLLRPVDWLVARVRRCMDRAA